MRLIDADALPRHKQLEAMGNGKYEDVEVVYANDIYNAPKIDAVPVVRCKDCKHYAFTDNRVPQERVWWCYYWGYEIGADDFCSHGERRDDETD